MNSNLIEFSHNIKQEPEEEFLCVLPSYQSDDTYKRDLTHVKQENEIQPKEIPKFECKICQKIYASTKTLKQHKKTHQKNQCKVCNRKFLPQSFEKHMKSHQNEKTERKIECKICIQKFLTNLQLNQHVKTHSKRFQCDLCGHYASPYKNHFMKHLKLHLVQGQYKCFFCRKLFDDQESFRFHSRQVHGDPKNRKGLTKADFFCETCGKEFDDLHVRRGHEKSHKEKVQCPICDKTIQPCYLAKHLKQHELKKKGIAFKCDICVFATAHKSYLKYHLEMHLNPEKAECNICMKKFKSSKTLENHLRSIHNLNVDPSKLCCNICHIQFPNLVALTRHKFMHKTLKVCPNP